MNNEYEGIKTNGEPFERKRGFTLIELIVVMSVVAVLVLLAVPKFLGQTKEATRTKHLANASQVEKAAERYYMDEQDWPRLTDDAYTSEQITDYAEKIYDVTGEEIELDPDGNYYDIDYGALDKYVKVPSDSDKNNYILQNPVGKVFYMEGLRNGGDTRVDYGQSSTVDSLDSEPVKFYGLDTRVFDGDKDTHIRNLGRVTWDGDLSHREILITSKSMVSYNPNYIRFYDNNKQLLDIPGTNSKSQLLARDSKTTTGVIVPEGAVEMELYGEGVSQFLYEISAPKVLSRPKNQSVTSTSTNNSITLNWPNRQRVQVYKDGIKIADSTGIAFVDRLLYSNSQHNYQILFVDEFGNASNDFVTHSARTKQNVVDFRGLDARVFDGDRDTHIRNLGRVTWEGDLANREILITSKSMVSYNPNYIRFYDKNKQLLDIPGTNSKSQLLARDSKTTTGVIVPEGAVEMELYGEGVSQFLYEIELK